MLENNIYDQNLLEVNPIRKVKEEKGKWAKS